ncbi:MAG: AAA-like domain-containing protein [Oscillospiraceae bacterium]|nr:AAA-like domain-containing protein [Oscillospiraceae bacterium]
MKEFNTTAVCIPDKHYMVDITDRVKAIKELVDAGKYFTINRARQYGKTTTLTALRQALQDEYIVVSLSFEGIGDAGFSDEHAFVREFCRLLRREFRASIEIPENVKSDIDVLFHRTDERVNLGDLSDLLLEWCYESSKKIVLFVDEVDSATNNQVFLDFLAQLRDNYINRDTKGIKTFQSVILAGVTDVKHLKGKIRLDDAQKENSPWNIAADFNIDMSLSETGIKGMLDEYEADHHIGMDTAYMAKLIWDETSGYPFLVSRLCQLIDERVSKNMPLSESWTKKGFLEAVKLILAESNTLFQTLTKNLKAHPALKAAIRSILMEGMKLTYNSDQDDIVQMEMYGLIKNDHNSVKVANRIFETRLYNLFMSEAELKNNVFYNNGELERNRFVQDGKLDMKAIFMGFIKTYNLVVSKLVDRFKEEEGREFFLLYLKPIINGTGNFYIEAQTRDQTRTDVIVDYLGEQYIIELKIWRGPRYNADGEKQISEYLDRFDLETGYMLSFSFNENKIQGIKEFMINGKKLIEATV